MSTHKGPVDQEIDAAKPSRVLIDRSRCKGCSYCVEICARRALVMSSDTNAKGYALPQIAGGGKCSGCRLCEAICPDYAIFVLSEDRGE